MSLHYLLEKGTEYAHKAVVADKKGDYETAIKYYKLAIDLFVKYLRLYPENSMADFYRSLIKRYKARINVLEKHLESVSIGGTNGGRDDFEVIMPEQRSRRTFKDIVDLEHVKKALKRAVIYPVKNPKLYPLGWPKGILLFGPPGCGKTLIAYALANEVNAALINVSPATIMSKWLGEAEKNVAKIFSKARELASKGIPVIIFIDEVDGLLQEYSEEVGGEKRVRNQFLMEMDGLREKENNKLLIFVIGTTNKPWKLDIGFIRRFEKRIYVPPPDKRVRKALFKYYIEQLREAYSIEDIDYDKLAELTEGYSSADIYSIIKETQANLAEKIIEKGTDPKNIKLSTEEFIEIIKTRKPSIDKKIIQAYKVWDEKYGTY
jgi:vacuolar protein-sorting-associated protein 4